MGDTYRWEDGALVRVRRAPFWALAACGATVAVALLALLVGDAVWLPFAIVGIPMVTLVLGYALFGEGPRLALDRVDLDGVELNGRRVRYELVRVEDHPGERVRIELFGRDGRHVVFAGEPDPTWNVQALDWLARVLGSVPGVSREGAVDLELWRRWQVEPALRARLEMERRTDASRRMHAALHEVEPVCPPDARVDLDRVRWGRLVLEGNVLRGRREVLLRDIQAIEPVFSEPCCLLVRTRLATFPIDGLERTVEDAAGAAWFVEQVRQAMARDAGRTRGSLRDVPEVLRRLSEAE